uniref:Uncharacterized protein n=1 Tax=Rhizophora mucronata TaxID=61149 RepID=A0A2P2QTV6_RHIMU
MSNATRSKFRPIVCGPNTLFAGHPRFLCGTKMNFIQGDFHFCRERKMKKLHG